jgi:hypothetical protein
MKMRTAKQISLSTQVLQSAEKQLEARATQLRGELLEVFETLSKVSGKPVTHYLHNLQTSVSFRIRLLNGLRKRKVGRPAKAKEKTHGSK